MADFDSLFVDNLADFQPVVMQSHYTGRDTVGRARSSGSLERTGSGGSPSNSLTPPQLSRSTPSTGTQKRPLSYPPHRRQLSSGTLASSSTPNPDPFSEIMSEFWAEQGGSPHGVDSPGPSESVGPPLHTDRLLSFRMHQPSNVMLLDAMGNPVNAKVAAQLHGMFFLAESPWDGAGNASTAPGGAVQLPKELTCYRRNLFQVSGSLSMPHISALLLSEEGSDITADPLGSGKRRVIQGLEASISGIESVELSPVKIITVPWKSAAANVAQQTQQPAPQSSSEDFPPMSNSGRPLEKEPLPISFDYPAAFYPATGGIPPEEDEDSYKYPLNWKRLQFRSATANNGRRKDLQQHFLVKITIFATLLPENMAQTALEKLEKVAICEAYSGAIIVRGRSPRNFSSRNDIPLTGSAIVSSRHNSSAAANSSSSSASAAKKARHHSSSSNLPYDDEQKPNMHQLNLEDPAYGIASTQGPDFMSIDNQGLLPMGDLSFASNLWGSNGTWMDMSSTAAGLGVQPLQSQAALGMPYGFDPSNYADLDPSNRLSLTGMLQSDDFSNPNQPHFYSNQRPANQENSMPPPSTRPSAPRLPSAQSPSMDLLYEYFPIGVDDWLPPVDVVYRPHAAHHQTQLPSKGNTRSKRLFSEVPFE